MAAATGREFGRGVDLGNISPELESSGAVAAMVKFHLNLTYNVLSSEPYSMTVLQRKEPFGIVPQHFPEPAGIASSQDGRAITQYYNGRKFDPEQVLQPGQALPVVHDFVAITVDDSMQLHLQVGTRQRSLVPGIGMVETEEEPTIEKEVILSAGNASSEQLFDILMGLQREHKPFSSEYMPLAGPAPIPARRSINWTNNV